MRLIAAIMMSVVPLTASAGKQLAEPSEGSASIARGLAFLTKDALAWKKDHNCVSCHHAALVIWSMREAKQRGYAVDEPVLADLTKWVAESGDGRTGLPRPASAPKALNEKAVLLALALNADAKPDSATREGLKRLLKTVESDQIENGSWSAWPETRQPIFSDSDATATVLATLAVLPAAATNDASAKATRDKAVQWLAKTKTEFDPRASAMRLLLSRRLGRPADEWEPLIRNIKQCQNADGGWSQTKEMPSDAWATGQALYALAHAGIKPAESVITRARAFLIKTQRSDGSWPMISRPIKPGGEGSKSLIPITCAGSAWAVLGLVGSR